MRVLVLLLLFVCLIAPAWAEPDEAAMTPTAMVQTIDPVVELEEGDSAAAAAEIIVAGPQPVTMATVRDHIRLLEFTLGLRLTTAQKDSFLDQIRQAGPAMSPEECSDLAQVSQLVANLGRLDEPDREEVRVGLLDEFSAAATEFSDDPASRLFTRLRETSTERVAEFGGDMFRAQDLEAFGEWLSFARSRGTSLALPHPEQVLLRAMMKQGFSGFDPVTRQTLCGFDGVWHMIRVAVKRAEPGKIAEWLSAINLPENAVMTETVVRAALRPDIWSEMDSLARKAGERPQGWVGTQAVNIW